MTKTSNILDLFKPKSKDEIIKTFCDDYQIDKIDENIILKMIRTCNFEKKRYISENKLEMAMAYRVDERILEEFLRIYLYG